MENEIKSTKRTTHKVSDVLDTIANISNDEVFTPPKLANDMLDLLPKEIWSNPDATFLDPCCKTGVFLREIAKRLNRGLEEIIPDKDERIKHILSKQIYGIATTKLCFLMTKRTLYGTKFANGQYSFAEGCFDGRDNPDDGNIVFDETLDHDWNKDGKCRFCGISKKVLEERGSDEKYCYWFIHKKQNEIEEYFRRKFGIMRIDVMVGNPPYQVSDGGGTGDSAKPIYNLFADNCFSLKPCFVSIIMPSRFMKGGKGLDDFRQKMMRKTSIKKLVDFEECKQVFASNTVDGGICYFLYDEKYNGECEFVHVCKDGFVNESKRFLENGITDKIIRDSRQIEIISKAKVGLRFSDLVSARNPYGFCADFFNNEDHYKIKKENFEFENSVKIYGVKGNKGGAKRTFCYIDKNDIIKNKENSLKFKIFFSKAYMTTSVEFPEPILANPKEICTETFLEIGCFENKEERDNCYKYMRTSFFKSLLFFNRSSLNISTDSFALIPRQNFTKTSDIDWSLSIKEIDEQLFEKYKLTGGEISFIKKMILSTEEK